MKGIHPSESEPLLIARLASLDLDVVPESFTARIIRDGIDATAPAIRRAVSGARSRHFLILHEYATSLDFAPHVLLTPHVTRGMPFIPIAYLPYNVGQPVPFEQRMIAASFRGSMTSDLRARLAPHPAFGHPLPAHAGRGATKPRASLHAGRGATQEVPLLSLHAGREATQEVPLLPAHAGRGATREVPL